MQGRETSCQCIQDNLQQRQEEDGSRRNDDHMITGHDPERCSDIDGQEGRTGKTEQHGIKG